MNFEIICNRVVALEKEVRLFIQKERETFSMNKLETKGLHDFVSYVDKTSEKMLVKGLYDILPEASFIAEEGTIKHKEAEYQWIIDPLDGTTNFVHGISPYAISIALMEKDVVVMGVVLECSLNECFYAWKNSNAYLNGKEIKVSSAPTINDSLVATGFPYYDFTKMTAYLSSLEYFMKESHGIRRLGSAATDLVYVAAGRFELFYEYSLQPWDVAAGAFIVQQAGGRVSDFQGKNNFIFGKQIIATNAMIFDESLERINNYFEK
jgi:Archaeal fructose-1,6-bisphosphatase and related enzymes of inositol monophosphatase family